ncbi:MAG: type II toxin-antitoxin system VapC family toxin [Mesorhizobium sp.]
MSMVDSSALVAILAPEPDGEEMASRVQSSSSNVTSPIVVFETVTALCRIRKAAVAPMLMIVHDFLGRAGIRILPVEADLHIAALAAFEQYGKVSNHPANLNLGDCFSYAMAKRSDGVLIYKGDDFGNTDLAWQ